MTATAELVQRIALSRKPRNKRTMNASTEVDEPRSTGNPNHNLVTLPDFHPEYVVIKADGTTQKKYLLTRAEQ